MENHPIEDLIVRKLMGETLSHEEEASLQAWLDTDDEHRAYYSRMLQGTFSSEHFRQYRRINPKKAFVRFEEEVERRKNTRLHKLWLRYAAAVLLPILMLGGFYLYQKPQKENIPQAKVLRIVPGSTQATLHTADGNTLELDSLRLAEAAPSSISILKPSKGIVMPQQKGSEDTLQQPQQATAQNVLQTAHNGEFQIMLEDGTLVHLNYNTVLRFPEHFSSRERVVYLEGEAFFQVARDKQRPFKVMTRDMTVKEYGTEFNVNTYSSKRTEVVLVEGSIGILNGEKETLLKPGERAVMDAQSTGVKVYKVDVYSYIAWHEGRFVFDNERLGDIMETLSHWYNVEVVFDKPELKELHFIGNLDRYGSLSSILNAISHTKGLRIEIKGNKVYIYQ